MARGDLLVAAVTYSSNGSAVAVTDSLGNDFLQLDALDGVNGGFQGLSTFYAPNVDGGFDVVTVTFTPATANAALYVAEYSGLAPIKPLETHQMDSEPNTQMFGVSVTVSTVPALVWAFAVDVGSGESAPFDAGPGFTFRDVDGTLWVDDVSYFGGAEDHVTTSTGPQNASWSFAVTDDFIGAAAVFQGADAGP